MWLARVQVIPAFQLPGLNREKKTCHGDGELCNSSSRRSLDDTLRFGPVSSQALVQPQGWAFAPLGMFCLFQTTIVAMGKLVCLECQQSLFCAQI
jgi:hypothetical protein